MISSFIAAVNPNRWVEFRKPGIAIYLLSTVMRNLFSMLSTVFRTLSIVIVSFVALTFVGCGTVGKNINDVTDGNPQYLTKAEIIAIISGEVLRETPTHHGRIRHIRRYIYADGRTTAMTHSSATVIQKTFWGTWSVDDKGVIHYIYDLKYATQEGSAPGEFRSTGYYDYRVVKIGRNKYAYIKPNSEIVHKTFYVE